MTVWLTDGLGSDDLGSDGDDQDVLGPDDLGCDGDDRDIEVAQLLRATDLR